MAKTPETEAFTDTSANGKCIEKIIYINLDERADRRSTMESQLRLYATMIPWSRMAGIKTTLESAKRSSALSPLIKNTNVRDRMQTSRLDFTLSVKLSHMLAWMQVSAAAARNPAESISKATLVLEDDTSMAFDWHTKVMRGLSHIPSDWEVVRVDTWWNNNAADRIWTDGQVSVFKAGTASDWSWYADAGCPDCDNVPENHFGIYYYGAQAVLVQPSTVDSLISKIQSAPIADVDSLLVSAAPQGISGLKAYVIEADVLQPGDTGG